MKWDKCEIDILYINFIYDVCFIHTLECKLPIGRILSNLFTGDEPDKKNTFFHNEINTFLFCTRCSNCMKLVRNKIYKHCWFSSLFLPGWIKENLRHGWRLAKILLKIGV
jgi:hypothetical protein